MADLTLSEYNGVPEKKLGHALQTEARKMFDSDAINKHSEDGVSEEPRPKVGASSNEKAVSAWGLAPPNLQSAIHPRAKYGAFWLFHVK